MALLVGIDEAGYGPILGPLMVSGAAFTVPDDAVDGCLWKTFRETCTKKTARNGKRLAIADSKKLFHGGDDLTLLERPALVMLATTGSRLESWKALLSALTAQAVDDLQEYPWYESDVTLPIRPDTGDIGTRANAVRRNGDAHGVRMFGVFCEPLWEGHFNRLLEKVKNKSVIVWGQVMRIIRRALRDCEEKHVRVVVDRLGGRTHYREPLSVEFVGFDLQIVEESDTCSAYRLTGQSRLLDIKFVTSGETHHFPIALASIYGKYLRELSMHVFNRYWCTHAPGLKPTAGYYADGKRWLKDAEPLLDRLTINRRMLVRKW